MGLREWLGISARDAPNVTDSRKKGRVHILPRRRRGLTFPIRRE